MGDLDIWLLLLLSLQRHGVCVGLCGCVERSCLKAIALGPWVLKNGDQEMLLTCKCVWGVGASKLGSKLSERVVKMYSCCWEEAAKGSGRQHPWFGRSRRFLDKSECLQQIIRGLKNHFEFQCQWVFKAVYVLVSRCSHSKSLSGKTEFVETRFSCVI